MSQGNIQAVQECFDAWNRRDADGWIADAHPEVEWSSAVQRQVEGPESVYRGRDGLRRFWDETHRVWNMEIELVEMRDVGDAVVVVARGRVTGKASGAGLERTIGYVFQFEDGLIRRATAYLSAAEAMAAVGLAE